MSTHPIIFKTPKRIQRTYPPKQKTNQKKSFEASAGSMPHTLPQNQQN
jgi:hypothetical protein